MQALRYFSHAGESYSLPRSAILLIDDVRDDYPTLQQYYTWLIDLRVAGDNSEREEERSQALWCLHEHGHWPELRELCYHIGIRDLDSHIRKLDEWIDQGIYIPPPRLLGPMIAYVDCSVDWHCNRKKVLAILQDRMKGLPR